MKLLVLCNMTMHRAKATLQNNSNMPSCFFYRFVDNYSYNCDLSVVVFVVFYYFFFCLYLPSFYYFHHCMIIAFCCHHSFDVYILAWLVEVELRIDFAMIIYVCKPIFFTNRRLSYYAPHTRISIKHAQQIMKMMKACCNSFCNNQRLLYQRQIRG